MKRIIYPILTVASLYCAEQTNERLDKYPIDILGQIAEFMPADSEFVKDMYRLVELSPEKYYEIAQKLVFSEEIGRKYKITYDYDSIDNIINKHFSTTALQKLSPEKLKEHIAVALKRILDENPIIPLVASGKNYDASLLNDSWNKGVQTLLFIENELSTNNNQLSLALKTNNEIKEMYHILKSEKEYTFLFDVMSFFIIGDLNTKINATRLSLLATTSLLVTAFLKNSLQNPFIISAATIFSAPLIYTTANYIKYYLFRNNEIGEYNHEGDKIYSKCLLLIKEHADLKLAFYTEFRKRIPVSFKEIEETAKLCIKNSTKVDKYKEELLLGLNGDKLAEVSQLLENEIEYQKQQL